LQTFLQTFLGYNHNLFRESSKS